MSNAPSSEQKASAEALSTDKPKPSNLSEREAFEKWYLTPRTEADCDDYRDSFHQPQKWSAWEAWQARAALASQEQPPQESALLDALARVLPMAKGWAHEHPVGANQEIVNAAEKILRNCSREQPPQEPAACEPTNEMRIALVTQIDELCSQIENSIYAFGNDEAAVRQARGAVNFARRIALPYRYNGKLRCKHRNVTPGYCVQCEREYDEASK